MVHWSFSVQPKPSSQNVPTGAGGCVQPVAGTHESEVHGSRSSQSGDPVPLQLPPAQRSVTVHALPSSHASVLGTFEHAVPPHESVVHGLPSLQPSATHVVPQHICAAVHVLDRMHVVPSAEQTAVSQGPATHVAVLHAGYWQPVAKQRPPGAAVQSMSVGTCVQPVIASHPSTVHGMKSSQLVGPPPWHVPPLQGRARYRRADRRARGSGGAWPPRG